MEITPIQLAVYKTEYQCDACQKANVVFVGLNNKKSGAHQCPNCQVIIYLEVNYPKIEFK